MIYLFFTLNPLLCLFQNTLFMKLICRQRKPKGNPKQKLKIKKFPRDLRKTIKLQMTYYCKTIHLTIQFASFRLW